jgi:hypothetical protein
MFGLGFLNTLFLFGLAAMALPIIIHILNRRRLSKVPFSSLEFIVELSQRRMSKVNLRRWIILLLRTLAIVLIVLAFARPTIRASAALFMPGNAPKHVVICLDASMSMGAEQETGTAFTLAKDIAKRVVEDSGGNDLIDVIVCGARSELVFGTGTKNKQVAQNMIEALAVTTETTSLSRAVEAAFDQIGQSNTKIGEIYVISDFRETTDSVLVADVPDGIRVIALPVYKEAIDNVSIDRVFTPRKLIRPGEVVRVGVAVTNHSRQKSNEFPIELVIDGKRKAEKLVSLSPAASANVTFSVSINDWGTYRCRVAKHHDRLPVDDDRYFLLEVSQKIPVTLIRGRKFADQGKQAASYFYVDKALNPRGSGEGEFSVTVIDERELTAASLPSKGVVVWTEPRELDPKRFELLKRYVQAGGAVMVFLGGDRKGLWRNESFARYLGIQKATPKEAGGAEHFSAFQNDHPVFSIFSEEELELLSRSRVRKHLSVSGVAPDSTLAYLGSGDPGIWECRRGKGRAIVIAAAPDLPSGDLPLSPMFLPLIHTAVSYLASSEGSELHRENYAGSDLFFDLPAAWSGQSTALRVVGENGEERKPVFYDSADGETRAMISRAQQVGFYRLLEDTTAISQAAINVDTRESNLNPQLLDGSYLGAARMVDTSINLAANLQREKQGREVYALFLLLAISALVLESLLGRKA